MSEEKIKNIDLSELSFRQKINIYFWILVNKKKYFEFAQKLDDGMSIHSAFKTTKSEKK